MILVPFLAGDLETYQVINIQGLRSNSVFNYWKEVEEEGIYCTTYFVWIMSAKHLVTLGSDFHGVCLSTASNVHLKIGPKSHGSSPHEKLIILGSEKCQWKITIEIVDLPINSMVISHYLYLVGGFKHEVYFPFHIWDVILPIDELIFFRGVGIPPTRILSGTCHGSGNFRECPDMTAQLG